jgi:hypothetical protein
LGPQPLPELLGQDSELRGFQRFKAQLSTIDFFGQLLFLFGLGLLVLGLTWGGASYPWNDARVSPTHWGIIPSFAFVPGPVTMTKSSCNILLSRILERRMLISISWGIGSIYARHRLNPLRLLRGLAILDGSGRYLSRKFPLEKPVFKWALLAQRNMYLLFYINFATGMGT